jgi:hypothetical protein
MQKKNQGQQWMPGIQQDVEDVFVERPGGMPPLSMIKVETAKLGLPDSDADYIHDAWLANGFKNARGIKIAHWRAAIRNWFRNGFFPSQKTRAKRPSTQDIDQARLEKIRRLHG